MTGNPQAIGFLLSWVLGWSLGGSLLEAGLTNAGIQPPQGSPLISGICFVLWSLLWGGGGVWLYQRWTQPEPPRS